jgi:NAD(P)-dependent dehydrogenase (short-subunit alcohol dehydrogenase family)
MSTSTEQKIALITGANKGIGFEIARQLAERDAHVIIAARNEAAGKNAAQKLSQGGKSASFLPMDVSDTKSIVSAASDFGRQFSRLDVLINNAGIYPDDGLTILTISREQLIATFQTNTFGALAVVQAFLPHLKKSSASRIINLSSGYGQLDGLTPAAPSYCLSKLALDGLTIMLSEALASAGIAVNAMSPGWVRTDMGGAEAPRSVAQGADTAVWLATDAPQATTGKFFQDRVETHW